MDHYGMIIHLISSPRNVSTAFMYSMGQHSEVFPMDEPFYAAYLAKTQKDHPGKDLILQSQPVDRKQVFEEIRKISEKISAIFIKNMAHHLEWEDGREMKGWKNCFLIRDSRLQILSYSKVIARPELEDLGITLQKEWFDRLMEAGEEPLVIDANLLLEHPERVLRQVCVETGLPFRSEMLAWPKGPKDFDGCWSPYWYSSVHQSTGFGKPRYPDGIVIPDNLTSLLDLCMPAYEYLYTHSIK